MSFGDRYLIKEDNTTSSYRLLSSAPPSTNDYTAINIDERKALSKDSEKNIRDSDYSLNEARRLLADTENLGIETISSLDMQNGQLGRSLYHLDDTDNNITRGRRVMRKINRCMCFKNILLSICVILCLLALAFVFYMYFFYQPTTFS